MFGSAKEPGEGLTFIGPGTHLLSLARFVVSSKAGEAPKYRADFVVVSGDTHRPGDVVSKTFKPYDNPFPDAGKADAGRMMEMVCALCDIASSDRVAAATQCETMLNPSQPARGFRVTSVGYDKAPKPNTDGSPKLDKYGKPKGSYTVVKFHPANPANTREQIAGDRARIDALPQMQSKAQAPVASAPAEDFGLPTQAPAAPPAAKSSW